MKAHLLLKKNIDTLLTGRGQRRKDLALWCRRSESWLSQIFTDDERNMPLKYLDRIADFFGLATYQLFQPGISPLTERRKSADRRSGRDRRISHLTQEMRGTLAPANAHITEADIADLLRLRTLSEPSRVEVRKVADALARAEREAGLPRSTRRAADAATTPAKSRAVGGDRGRPGTTAEEG